mmetsp:Transcript_65387/g.108654  ORF Transcript_65387/g.108654 Transcript_65387/m.108654 type:complete len:297 (+) Transcript_65387:92-982(+)
MLSHWPHALPTLEISLAPLPSYAKISTLSALLECHAFPICTASELIIFVRSNIPTFPQWLGISEIREALNLFLLQLRSIGLEITLCMVVGAIVLGLLLGDRSRRAAAIMSKRNMLEGLRTEMTAEQAEEWDRGGAFPWSLTSPVANDSDEPAKQDARLQPLSARRWLELALCAILDMAGIASFYYPFGEVSDVAFALFYAATIEAFFNWPLMAAVGFWEEVIPFTDFFPTATLTWLLVVTGFRRRLISTAQDAQSEALQLRRRSPIADSPTEQYLQEGDTWLDRRVKSESREMGNG